MVTLTLSYDMRAPDIGPAAEVLYGAALDQCEWADSVGFHSVGLSEHHASPDGYLPSPLIMAAAIGARTRRVRIGISLLLLPFYNLYRLAEDAAVCDLVCGGRLDLMFGAGYREEEFEMYGVDIHRRGRTMDEGIEFLKQAWTGEPFTFQGREVHVLPRPAQRPRPAIVLGGASPASAKRAARIADGYAPIAARLYEIYLTELERLGKPIPQVDPTVRAGAAVVAVSDDPERTWAAIEPNLMHDALIYGQWTGGRRGTMFATVQTTAELQASGQYLVLTPEECIAKAEREGELRFRPLVGGMDPSVASDSFALVADKVLPHLDLAPSG